MRIRTQLTIDVALFGAILVIIAGSLFDTNRQAERLNRQLEVARSLEQGAAELGYLANDYLLHHELPQCTRMEARFSSFSASFSLLSPSSPEQQALANGIAAGRRQLKAVLDEMVSASGSAPPAPDAAAELAWIRLSWSRFQVLIQGMVFDTSRQSLLLHEQMDRLKQTSILLIFSLIGASAAYFLTSYLLIYRRAIRSISRLQAGTRIIGAGNLDFRLEEGAGDEIGQLAGAFNRMTAGLKEVTASKTELEREMAERRRAEREREMTIEFLHLVNRSTSTRELIETAVGFFQRQSGCEAVGVRLRDGEDYPYFEARGFPPQFVATENSLCTRDPTGRIQRDHAGDPVLSCMCGNVICGRFDPAKPFFTSAGSFWTSSTTELLAATCEADRLARTRNRCNGEGYESVALIALRLGEERLGLLQLNGRRKGVFSPATIALWERLAGYFAVALAKFRAEQALQEANETLEARVAERTALAESRTRQLQALAVQLSEAEERERRRVADLLHDDLQQILASARLRLQAAQAGLPSSAALAGVEHLLEESIRKSRRLSHELSPAILHHAGLYASLQWLGRQIKESHGLEVELEANGCADSAGGQPLKTLIFRSVQELLFNVVKHAQAQSARVSLSGSGEHLSVTVTDRGKGFDAGILDPFADGQAGFGLLSIRERIQAFGGSLAIESTPGAGSCIRLTVPLVPAKGDTAAALEKPAPARHPTRTALVQPIKSAGAVGHRVLFVDDHKVMRQGLIAIISGQPDIQVVGEAANGREAIELAREIRPDVIVMDISMPEMDGIEATRRIKAELPEVRVIGLSMLEEENIEEQMRRAEALVSKTDSSGGLLRTIYGMNDCNE